MCTGSKSDGADMSNIVLKEDNGTRMMMGVTCHSTPVGEAELFI